MSVNTVTDGALTRSREFRAAARQDQIQPEQAAQNNSVANTLSALAKYIPTEVVTLYIAAVAASTALQSQWAFITPARLYWFFVIFTPLFVLLTYIGKRKAAVGLPVWPSSAREWPWWSMFAPMVAFMAWALAVPDNGILDDGVIGAFLALFVSILLTTLEPLFSFVREATPPPEGGPPEGGPPEGRA
jgi:hypothetical protein